MKSDNKENIHVLVVEDEVLIAQDIKKRLSQLGYGIITVVYNSDRALDILHSRKIDFAVLDINIGGTRNGIELAQIINKKYKFPFIYLTSYSDAATLKEARVTLPYGYIVKPFDNKDLASTLEVALYKYEMERREIVPEKGRIEQVFLIKLGSREYEVLGLLIDGHTLSKISESLFLSENTIKSHVKSIYSKLDVHSRAELSKKVLMIEG